MAATKLIFIAYCVFALALSTVPFISTPFLYLTTVFHELSHGLATLLTGGVIQEFDVQASGAGHLVSRGGYHTIIAFSGYFGAPIWGALLYLSAAHITLGRITLMALIGLFLVTLVLWVNTLMTAAILLLVIAVLACVLLLGQHSIVIHMIRAMAILVVFNAILGPLYLIGSPKGDSVTLSQLLFVPAIVWVGLWFCWGLFILLRLFKTQPKAGNNLDATNKY